MTIPIDAPIRSNSKDIGSLCGTCQYFAKTCYTRTKTNMRNGYIAISSCDGYMEETKVTETISANGRIKQALDVIVQYGGIDGGHHKAWVLDQAVRALTGCIGKIDSQEYINLVKKAKRGDDGPETYDWNVGIAP